MTTDPLPPVPAFSRIDSVPSAAAAGTLADGTVHRPLIPPVFAGRPQRRPMDDAQREVLLRLVRDALESGQPDAALELLDRLWSADLTREDCWYLRGQSLYELRRFAEAGEMAGLGLARVPRSVALLYRLGNCELKLNDMAGAERAIREALTLAPEHPVLLCRLAELLTRAGRLDEAGLLLEWAATASPGHPLVGRERAALQAARGLDGEIPLVLEGRPDLYGRAAIGLTLLGLVAATTPDGRDAGRGSWLMLGRVALVGAAIALAALGFRLPAVLAFVTALAGPRLWKVRG